MPEGFAAGIAGGRELSDLRLRLLPDRFAADAGLSSELCLFKSRPLLDEASKWFELDDTSIAPNRAAGLEELPPADIVPNSFMADNLCSFRTLWAEGDPMVSQTQGSTGPPLESNHLDCKVLVVNAVQVVLQVHVSNRKGPAAMVWRLELMEC